MPTFSKIMKISPVSTDSQAFLEGSDCLFVSTSFKLAFVSAINFICIFIYHSYTTIVHVSCPKSYNFTSYNKKQF